MAYPAMTAPLAANPYPAQFEAGPLGKLTVDGVLTGVGLWQSHPSFDAFGRLNADNEFDVSNAQIIINKSDGPVQFYIQAGDYSILTLGTPYYRSDKFARDTYGFVPQGFLKLVPNSSFNILVGALPTLIGAEYTFSFENMNIERGLLWGQEPAVSKGVQANYGHGPWAASLAITDGYYSDSYTSVSGSTAYTFKNQDTLTFVASGNASDPRRANFVTPLEQNDGQIFNLIYSHTKGPLTITPYLQYGASQRDTLTGAQSGSAWGGAVLAKYNFTPAWSLSGRAEVITSRGPANLLGYGAGSNAWSLTLTPAYQKGIFYVRGELSYVGLSGITPGVIGAPGTGFGAAGAATEQVRAMVEAGTIF